MPKISVQISQNTLVVIIENSLHVSTNTSFNYTFFKTRTTFLHEQFYMNLQKQLFFLLFTVSKDELTELTADEIRKKLGLVMPVAEVRKFVYLWGRNNEVYMNQY